MANKDITPQDIIQWVMDNRDDQEVIDMVSHMIFPYTSKYKNLNQPYKQRYSNNGRVYHADEPDVNVHI